MKNLSLSELKMIEAQLRKLELIRTLSIVVIVMIATMGNSFFIRLITALLMVFIGVSVSVVAANLREQVEKDRLTEQHENR